MECLTTNTKGKSHTSLFCSESAKVTKIKNKRHTAHRQHNQTKSHQIKSGKLFLKITTIYRECLEGRWTYGNSKQIHIFILSLFRGLKTLHWSLQMTNKNFVIFNSLIHDQMDFSSKLKIHQHKKLANVPLGKKNKTIKTKPKRQTQALKPNYTNNKQTHQHPTYTNK